MLLNIFVQENCYFLASKYDTDFFKICGVLHFGIVYQCIVGNKNGDTHVLVILCSVFLSKMSSKRYFSVEEVQEQVLAYI